MTGETRMSLAMLPEGRDIRCRLHVVWYSVPENGGCDRKRVRLQSLFCFGNLLYSLCQLVSI